MNVKKDESLSFLRDGLVSLTDLDNSDEQFLSSLFFCVANRLVGPVVKASASGAEDSNNNNNDELTSRAPFHVKHAQLR